MGSIDGYVFTTHIHALHMGHAHMYASICAYKHTSGKVVDITRFIYHSINNLT